MIRSFFGLCLAVALGLAAVPAPAGPLRDPSVPASAATARLRAEMARTTARPIRQIGPHAAPRRAELARLAPAASPRPPVRPAALAARTVPCRSARVCAQPLPVAPPVARLAARRLIELPTAAPGQVVIVTDGRVQLRRLR